MYQKNYQYTHDIDWFCVFKNRPIHLASNGGLLPATYNIKDIVKIQHIVSGMPTICDYTLNESYVKGVVKQLSMTHLEDLSEDEEKLLYPESMNFMGKQLSIKEKAYCWSFIEMAQKGFYSYDRSVDDNMYYLVASPIGSVINVPQEIQRFDFDVNVLNGPIDFFTIIKST